MPTRIDHAAPRIFQTLDRLPHPVLRQQGIRRLLEGHRTEWNLALSMNLTRFTEFLIRRGKLRQITLNLRDRRETLYAWGDVSALAIAVSVKPNAYLCHQTAMFLHGLTAREPQSIYVNDEQRPLPAPEGPLDQRAINRRRPRPHRRRQRPRKARKPAPTNDVG